MNINKRYRTLKEKRKVVQAMLKDIDDAIEHVQAKCTHPNIVEEYGIGDCPDCGYQTSEWFCPDSPTYECDYYDRTTDTYDEDCCIYCGNPEERK